MAKQMPVDEYPEYFTWPCGMHNVSTADRDLSRSDPPRRKHDDRYRYSYDPFTVWGNPGPNKECNGSDYADRLEQWDRDKYQRLAAVHFKGERVFGEYCKGDRIEAFLRDWHDDPNLKLLRVIEYCDWSTGYATWRFDYKHTKKVR